MKASRHGPARSDRRTAALLAAFALLLAVGGASAQSEDPEDETVVLEGSREDLQFLAGGTVLIRAAVADDIFAAGRDVVFEGASSEHAIVAGYAIEQRGGTLADLVAAAASITLAGAIGDDLVAAARHLRITPAGTIGGVARVAAETVEVEGRVGGSMKAAARRIVVSGEIAGKADLIAERIVLEPGAVIGGDLVYRSRAEPEIAAGARVGGRIRRLEADMTDLRSFGLAVLGIGVVVVLSWVVAMLLLVMAVQLALPCFTAAATRRLAHHPLSNLGGGVAALLIGGALAGMLVFSVLATPLGLALLMALAIAVLLGLVTASAGIGDAIRRRFKRAPEGEHAERLGWVLAGFVLIGLLTAVPIVGGIVAALLVAAGFGAAAAELWTRLRAA